MPRPFSPKVLAANDLLRGHAVWRDATGGWTRRIEAAEILDSEAAAELALLDAEARGHEVVGPYLADVRRGPAGPEPAALREAMRVTGPSVTIPAAS